MGCGLSDVRLCCRLVGEKTDVQSREKWWNELRDVIRGHCEMYSPCSFATPPTLCTRSCRLRRYKCDCVLGYRETLSTSSGVCIM